MFVKAANWVLAGSDLPKSTIVEIAKAVERQDRAQIACIMNYQDFYWPWFEECLDFFSTSNRWPDSSPWSWFESEPDLITGKKDVLDKLKAKILKNIAARYKITIPKSSKVADIRKLLSRKMTVNQLAPYRTILNKRIIDQYTEKQLENKYLLLSVGISSKQYNLHRHQQISELILDMGYKAKFEWESALIKRLANAAVFDVNNENLTPPFYPGDMTDIKSIPPKI